MFDNHTLYLSLGANIGNKKENITNAIQRIGELIGKVERQSSLYETKPWGFSSTNNFINACVKCRTSLTPLQVLHETQVIEKELGRTEKSHKGLYHDRLIDIDILLYDDLKMDTPELTIPHPYMYQRDFVMKPLREIQED